MASLGHPCKFQQVSHLGFVTAVTSLTRGQPNFARCLAVSWTGTLDIFGGCCPLTEFCKVQNSLYVQVLRSLILATLLHSTRAAIVSQALQRGRRNGITEVSQRAPPIFGWAAIMLGIPIVFLPCGFFYLLSSFSFFPRLISAVAEWMSTT